MGWPNRFGHRTHCGRGHKYPRTPKRRKDGTRICRWCHALYCARHRAKRKVVAA